MAKLPPVCAQGIQNRGHSGGRRCADGRRVAVFDLRSLAARARVLSRGHLAQPQEQQEARDQFVVQATALASDLHRPGHWQSLFTADQINAWLALELATNYPDLLPDELQRSASFDPRPNEATIACRYESGDMAAVLSLTVDAYLHEPNVLALRIRRARAGALPVPLAQVLDSISHAARRAEPAARMAQDRTATRWR